MLYGALSFCKGAIQFLTFLAGPLVLPVVFFFFLVAIGTLCRRYLFKRSVPVRVFLLAVLVGSGILSLSAVKNSGAFLPDPETFENPSPMTLSVPAADTLSAGRPRTPLDSAVARGEYVRDSLRIAPFIEYASDEDTGGDENDGEEKENGKERDFIPIGPFYMWPLWHGM